MQHRRSAHRWIHPALALLSSFFLLEACVSVAVTDTPIPPGPATPMPVTPGSGPVVLGQRTKTSGCESSNGLPDSPCTPGAVFPDATKDLICQPGYSSSVRNVPVEVKAQVYAEYGIASHEPGQYEVDHLISLELGGSNDIANLWPELADPRPGFHEKDHVEDYLHSQVCNGSMPLEQAQLQIASNWVQFLPAVP